MILKTKFNINDLVHYVYDGHNLTGRIDGVFYKYLHKRIKILYHVTTDDGQAYWILEEEIKKHV